MSAPLIYLALGCLPRLSVQSGSTAALCLGELVSRKEEAAELAALMALLVGAMHVLLGLLDLAAVVELFSRPLLRARTAAAALVVMLAQLELLCGVDIEPLGPSFHGLDLGNRMKSRGFR